MKVCLLFLSLAAALTAAPLHTAYMELVAAGQPNTILFSDGPGPQFLADTLTGRFGATATGSVLAMPGSIQLNASAVLPGAASNSAATANPFGYTEGLITFQCTGVCGPTTMVAFSFTVRGTATFTGVSFTDAEIYVNPFLEGVGALQESWMSLGGIRAGAFASRSSLTFNGEVFTLPAVEVPVGVPLFFSMQGGIAAYTTGAAAATSRMDGYRIEFASTPFVTASNITVDSADLAIVNNTYTSPSGVPEPASGALLAGAAAVLAWGRLKRVAPISASQTDSSSTIATGNPAP